jgi:hypothetical protein
VLLLAGCLAVGGGTVSRKLSGTEERSISFALACRTAWPFLSADYHGWPDELLEVLGDEVYEVSYAPDNMELIMKPLVENAFAEKEADRLYRVIAKNSWTHRTSVILTYIRWDVIGYAATPFILPAQLEGEKFDSCSGRNYEIMREQAPVLTKYYVRYSCWWFVVCIVCAALLTALLCIGERRFVWKEFWRGLAVCFFSAGVLVAWYTMQGSGIMDYKESFAVSGLWIIWALAAMREEEKDEEG